MTHCMRALNVLDHYDYHYALGRRAYVVCKQR